MEDGICENRKSLVTNAENDYIEVHFDSDSLLNNNNYYNFCQGLVITKSATESPNIVRRLQSMKNLHTQTLNSTTTDHRCRGNEMRDKIGYNSACIWDICEIVESDRSFGGRVIGCQSNSTTTWKFYSDNKTNRIADRRLLPHSRLSY